MGGGRGRVFLGMVYRLVAMLVFLWWWWWWSVGFVVVAIPHLGCIYGRFLFCQYFIVDT